MVSLLWIVAPTEALSLPASCVRQAVPLGGHTVVAAACAALAPPTSPAPSATCALPALGGLGSLAFAVDCRVSAASDGRSYVSGYFALS